MFSVIVPVYKSEKYLSECIDSILSQSFGDFELILADDGSPDRCPQICDEYAKKDGRIKVIHKPNGGSVSARKAGVMAARGEYLCFVDGDDFVASDMLERYNAALEQSGADMICAGYSEYREGVGNRPVAMNLPVGIYDKPQLEKLIYPVMLSCGEFFSFGIAPSLCCKCFRADLCRQALLSVPDGISLGDDAAVSYACLLNAQRVQLTDYCGYSYRQNPESMTHSYDGRLYTKLHEIARYMQAMAQTYGGSLPHQTDEYTVYLLMLAKNNEFRLRQDGTYAEKRRRMLEYLRDRTFGAPLGRVRIKNPRYRLTALCMRLRLLLPIYLYEQLKIIKNSKK